MPPWVDLLSFPGGTERKSSFWPLGSVGQDNNFFPQWKFQKSLGRYYMRKCGGELIHQSALVVKDHFKGPTPCLPWNLGPHPSSLTSQSPKQRQSVSEWQASNGQFSCTMNELGEWSSLWESMPSEWRQCEGTSGQHWPVSSWEGFKICGYKPKYVISPPPPEQIGLCCKGNEFWGRRKTVLKSCQGPGGRSVQSHCKNLFFCFHSGVLWYFPAQWQLRVFQSLSLLLRSNCSCSRGAFNRAQTPSYFPHGPPCKRCFLVPSRWKEALLVSVKPPFASGWKKSTLAWVFLLDSPSLSLSQIEEMGIVAGFLYEKQATLNGDQIST